MATETRKADIGTVVACLIFILLGVWVLWQTGDMSPLGSVFPRTIAIVMILCSVTLIAVALRRGRRVAADTASTHESTSRRVAFVVAMGIWIVLIPIIGFFSASLLAFIAILVIANYDPLPASTMVKYGLTAVMTVGVFYLLMTRVLLLPVPKGMLF